MVIVNTVVYVRGYPIAGWLGAAAGLPAAFALLAGLVIVATVAALRLWPTETSVTLEHAHEALEHEHLHVHDEHQQHDNAGWEGPEPHSHLHRHDPLRHKHAFFIDYHHAHWPP